MPDVVLITGASSGIGLELARQFAADGSELILVARREDRLRQLAEELKEKHQTLTTIIPCDLADPQGPRHLFDAVQAAGKTVDVLVNNAGFGQRGLFVELDLERQLKMLQVNNSALVHLTHLFLTGMVQRKRGAILNVGSTAAFQPGPNNAVYFATKAFVLSFSEAISEELRGSGVTVTVLCPGPTKTEFGADSQMDNTLIFQINTMSAEEVAKAGFNAVRKGQRIVMPGLLNKVLAGSVRFTPRGLILKVMDRLGKASPVETGHG